MADQRTSWIMWSRPRPICHKESLSGVLPHLTKHETVSVSLQTPFIGIYPVNIEAYMLLYTHYTFVSKVSDFYVDLKYNLTYTENGTENRVPSLLSDSNGNARTF